MFNDLPNVLELVPDPTFVLRLEVSAMKYCATTANLLHNGLGVRLKSIVEMISCETRVTESLTSMLQKRNSLRGLVQQCG